MGVEIKGLDKVIERLDEIKRNAEEIEGENQVSLNELFSDYFMMKYTNFATITEMFDKGGFKIKNKADFAAIPQKELDDFVQKNTQFASWKEMMQAAGKKWVQRKIGFGVGNGE